MKLRNINPLGIELDIPLVRRSVKHGDEFDVTEDQARRLLVVPVNFEPADAEAKAIADELEAETATVSGDDNTEGDSAE